MKSKYFISSFCAVLALLSVVFLIGLPEDNNGGSEVICAAIHPCNLDGSVFPPFNVGPCAEIFAEECARDLQDRQDISSRLNSCEMIRAKLELQVEEKTKKIAVLKKLLKKKKGR